MGNGISHRRIGRQHSGVGSAPPRVIPLPPGYPGSSAGSPYPPNAHHLSYYYPPDYHAAGPPSMDQQIYQQTYTNGQILMNMPSHVFRPVNSSGSCPRSVPMIPIVAEHQKANTIRNDVNLRKATLRLEKDDENPGHYLVAFSFDATVIGSICLFFLAKEGVNCSLTPLKPQLFKPVRVPFEKGLGQNFCQAPGTGVDLSLFSDEDLSKDGQDEVYPLVVRTEAIPKDSLPDVLSIENQALGAPLPKWIHSQTTHAVIERREGGEYGVRVVKQIIWVDGVRYELQEIYGIENSGGAAFEGNDSGKECVICMSEPRDTTVLPCRHMCMCSECAKVLRFQTNRCPICRSPVERLLEIRVPKGDCLDPVDGGQIKQGGESGLSTSTEGEPDGHKLSSVH